MSGKILEVQNLAKRFGGVVATKDVSFHVNQGEKLGILGPNGSGKTTLFNQISGFIQPDRGTIRFGGEDIKKLKPHQRAEIGMGRTFQLVRPFKDMSVSENLIVPFMSRRGKKLLKATGDNLEDIIDEILFKVGLKDQKEMPVGLLPHGELKKLEVAKVSALKPDLILLDEPFGGLSVGEINMISKYIDHLNRENNITFVVIEHRLREFMQLVERLVVLNYGELIAQGTPEEIVNNPLVIEAYLGKGGTEIAAA